MVLTARLPTAMATMLLPLMFTPALPPMFTPEPCTLTPVTVDETEAKLYCTLLIDALAVFRPAGKTLTWIALLAELP